VGAGLKVLIQINKETQRKLDNVAKDRMHEAVIELHKTTVETLSGSRSGRTYRVPGTKKTYTASSPGQPPAQATGRLRQSIKWAVNSIAGKLIGKVGTNLDYGVMLEYGTRRMKARPWLRVSSDKASAKIKQIFGRKWM